MTDLTKHEIEVLKWINGDIDIEVTGAWTNACIEFLQEGGYVTRGFRVKITKKGKDYLETRKILDEAANKHEEALRRLAER